MNDDAIVLVLDSNPHFGDQTLFLRVSFDAADDLRAGLEAEGVYVGEAQEAHLGPELAILIGSFAGGLGGLAAVLNAFFGRHRHKRFIFRHDGMEIDLSGRGEDEIARLVDDELRRQHERQLAEDAEWQRMKDRLRKPEDDPGT